MGGMTARIAPESEDLDFVRNLDSGTVHVLCWDDRPGRRFADLSEEDALAAILGLSRTLCGREARASLDEAMVGAWIYVERFPDDALCAQCHAALDRRGMAHRAFEHPQTDDEDSEGWYI